MPRAAFALAIALLAGCYDVPKPQCGFRCGPNNACPDDYTCNTATARCQLNSSPSTLQCDPAIDASVPDAPSDAAVDAPVDAPPDAPVDAPPDAPIDAPPDAADPPIDAPIDAPLDAPV